MGALEKAHLPHRLEESTGERKRNADTGKGQTVSCSS